MAPSSDNAGWSVGSIFASLFYKGATIGCGIVAVCIGLLYVKQESLLYFPEIGNIPRRLSQNPSQYRSPSEYSIPFESHMILCEDGVSIHSWLILQPDSNLKETPTLIFFHGNAGNIGFRLPNAYHMYEQLKVNILMVEYRGYGNSDDTKPTEAGLKLDSEAALNFLMNHAKIDSNNIFIFGRSLGGAVAFHVAEYAEKKQIPIAGVIVENTFLSIADMVDTIMPFVAPIKFLVLRIGWDSVKVAPKLKCPILYLAGDKDELVPHSHMKKLYELSRTSSIYPQLHVVRGGTHNETWVKGGRKYWQAMHTFIRKVISTKKSDVTYLSTDTGTTDSIEDEGYQNGCQNSVDSVAVGLGTDPDRPSRSIPIMPNNLMGIAKEATTTSVSDKRNTRKKRD